MSWSRARYPMALIAIIVALTAASCGGASEPELPSASAQDVIAYLEEVDYRENWALWPDLGELYPASDPHGKLLTTYLNATALDALNEKSGGMPDGAIIVKENYSADGVFEANTVMYKSAGFDPENNDWFWLKVLSDGTVEKEGKVEGCQSCHGQVKVNDYVWSGPLN